MAIAEEVVMTNETKRVHAGSSMSAVPVTVFVARLIYFVFGVIISMILLRVLLLLLAANRGNGIVDFVYDTSNTLIGPFHGMFSYTPTYGAVVFEISAFVAIMVYALIAWGLVALVTLGSRHSEDV